MTLKLGIHTGQQECSYDDLRRVWRLADSTGFYWVSIWDHFYEQPMRDSKGDCFEGVAIMSALAAETTNVRVGSLVFGMAYRYPAVLAKAAATVDHVSGGRLELGLGAGWYELEHTTFGIPFLPVRDRMDVMEEGVQIIKTLLTEGSVTFEGKHFQLENANCFPMPVQRPPRVWVGGRGERRTLRIAARYADGWNVPYISPEEYAHKIGVLDRWCDVEDRDPAETFPLGQRRILDGRIRRRCRERARTLPRPVRRARRRAGRRPAIRHRQRGRRPHRRIRRVRRGGTQHRPARALQLRGPPGLRRGSAAGVQVGHNPTRFSLPLTQAKRGHVLGQSYPRTNRPQPRLFTWEED